MESQKGFTLMESITVLAVLVTIGAMSYIPLTEIASKMGANADVADIVCNLNRARLAAVKHNSSIVADFSFSEKYSIFVDNGESGGIKNDWIRQPGEIEIVNFSYQKGMSVTSNFHLPKDKIRFNPRSCMKGGSLTVNSGVGADYKIVVNATGRVRVERI